MATNKQLEARIKDLETIVTTLSGGGATSAEVAALAAAVAKLQATPCAQESRITAIETKAASEAADQNVLEADHIPA